MRNQQNSLDAISYGLLGGKASQWLVVLLWRRRKVNKFVAMMLQFCWKKWCQIAKFILGRSLFETSRLLLSNFSESNPMAEESEFADGALGVAFVQHSDWDSWWWDGCLPLAKSVTAKIPVDLCNGTIVLAYKSLWWMYTLLVGSAFFAGRLFEDPFPQVCLNATMMGCHLSLLICDQPSTWKLTSCYNPFLFAMACLTAYPKLFFRG